MSGHGDVMFILMTLSYCSAGVTPCHIDQQAYNSVRNMNQSSVTVLGLSSS